MDKYKEITRCLRELAESQAETEYQYGVDANDMYVVWQAANAIEELLNVSEKPTGWIPVSELMPEEDIKIGDAPEQSDYVLITCINLEDDGHSFVEISLTIDGKWMSLFTRHEIPEWVEVVAWMPLPEPYKGVQDGQ